MGGAPDGLASRAEKGPIVVKLLIALLVGLLVAAAPAAAQERPTHLVVLNRAGPAWERVAEHAAAAREHFAIYKRLADAGDIVVGGRLDGAPQDPALGISVFRAGVDRDAVRKVLENDPLLKAGVTAIEFREWTIQMGALGRPAD